MDHNLWAITYGLRKTERDFKFERYICARPIFANYGMIGMCRTEIWRKTSLFHENLGHKCRMVQII